MTGLRGRDHLDARGKSQDLSDVIEFSIPKICFDPLIVAIGVHRQPIAEDSSRPSEVCLTILRGTQAIDTRFAEWKARDVTVVLEPEDAPFGRTFITTDPDGNLIRVTPVD
ncbi:VOC family protein [Haloglycomyces albus]|uniref:VOC family protein n=1 Tax=Haloglycomyces albus TaxID=526067 RepID=UPI003CCBEE51